MSRAQIRASPVLGGHGEPRSIRAELEVANDRPGSRQRQLLTGTHLEQPDGSIRAPDGEA
jgi:hypothetical protein